MEQRTPFFLTDESKAFSITILGHWHTKFGEKTINELNKSLEFRSQIRIELHIKEIRKRGNQIKTGDKEYKLSDFDTQKKNEILEELKKVKYNDLEDLVYRFQLTYDENIDILDLKYITTK